MMETPFTAEFVIDGRRVSLPIQSDVNPAELERILKGHTRLVADLDTVLRPPPGYEYSSEAVQQLVKGTVNDHRTQYRLAP